MKLEKELTYNQPEINIETDFKDIDKTIQSASENYKLLKSLSKKAENKYPILGGFFDLTVADGKVSYQIIEIIGKKAFAKRCAGICLDLYEDNLLGQGEWISTNKAIELVGRQRALFKLFGG